MFVPGANCLIGLKLAYYKTLISSVKPIVP